MASNLLKNIKKNPLFKSKEFLNAVITSDPDYRPKSKSLYSSFRLVMWIYAAIIFVVTSVSLSMLLINTKIQQQYAVAFSLIEVIVFIVLLIDFGLRWYTANIRSGKKKSLAYLLFPISISGVLLGASLLPSMYLINVWTGKDIKVFETFEAMKFLRIFRVILLANFVPGLNLFKKVLIKESQTLKTVFVLVVVTIFVFTLVIYNVELNQGPNPQVKNFFDALYFSTVTLTTIGFGDISPSTSTGRVIVMVMAILGLAILSIPSGVIAGGFISELKSVRQEKDKIKEKKMAQQIKAEKQALESGETLDNSSVEEAKLAKEKEKKQKEKDKKKQEKAKNKKAKKEQKAKNKADAKKAPTKK